MKQRDWLEEACQIAKGRKSNPIEQEHLQALYAYCRDLERILMAAQKTLQD